MKRGHKGTARSTPKREKGLYALVFRALGSSRLRDVAPAEQHAAALHVAAKLGGHYVKTRPSWRREVDKALLAHSGKVTLLASQLDALRGRVRAFEAAEALRQEMVAGRHHHQGQREEA